MSAFTRRDQNAIRRLSWDIASISTYLEELRHFWAKTIGITGAQWRIILILAEIDEGTGVPVNAVSKLLQVDSSFVTTQSKLLEKNGLMCRKASREDGRIVNLSLTDRTWAHLASLGSRQDALNEFIFAEFASRELEELTNRIGLLKRRFEKACLKVTIDA